MIPLLDHPALLASLIVLCYPVYRAMAFSIFGGRDGLASAVKYFKLPETWSPFRSPWSGDIGTEFRFFFFLVSCIAFVTAAYQLCARYLIFG